MNDMRDLYEELILDHNRNPRNYPKKPTDCNCTAHGHNPLCGDEFIVNLTVEDGVIKDIGFEGAGCAISTASASLMTEAIIGMPVEDADKLFSEVRHLLTDDDEDDDGEHADESVLGKLSVLKGVKEYPMRVKCATLAWHTMHAALMGKKDSTTE